MLRLADTTARLGLVLAWLAAAWAFSATMAATTALAQTSVVPQHNDAARTGANRDETALTTTNVNASRFGEPFERTVREAPGSQPGS